jgi:hypothetical protein
MVEHISEANALRYYWKINDNYSWDINNGGTEQVSIAV